MFLTTMDKIQYRKSFSQQPAHFLIVDTGSPMKRGMLRDIIVTVENVLALGASLRGRSRIPVFGVGVLTTTFQNLMSIDYVRGNFSNIIKVFESLLSQSESIAQVTSEEYKDALNFAVWSIMDEFSTKCMTDTVIPVNQTWPSQIQITITTMKNGCGIQEMLVEIMKEKSTVRLKSVEVLGVNLSEDGTDRGVIHHKTFGYVSHMSCQLTASSLHEYFKNWLLESDTEMEHVRLHLSKDPLVVVKCDMDECSLSPDHLPFGHRFGLHNDRFNTLTGSKISGTDIPIYELQALHTIETAGICPSILFGGPRRLRATHCWTLSWNESHVNKQLFEAVCRKLMMSGRGLVVSLRSHSKMDSMATYFVLVSDGETLMVTSVAPLELSLPPRHTAGPAALASPFSIEAEMCSLVDSVMMRLPPLAEFLPHDFSSGLFGNLKRNLRATPAKTIPTVKKVKSEGKKTKKSKNCASGSGSTVKTRVIASERASTTMRPGSYKPSFALESSPDMEMFLVCDEQQHHANSKHPALSSPPILPSDIDDNIPSPEYFDFS